MDKKDSDFQDNFLNKNKELFEKLGREELWHCEKPMVFDDHYIGRGWKKLNELP